MHSSYKYCKTLHDIDGWAARETEIRSFSRALGYNSTQIMQNRIQLI